MVTGSTNLETKAGTLFKNLPSGAVGVVDLDLLGAWVAFSATVGVVGDDEKC